MVFSIAKEQRDDLVDRMADSLAAIGFHNYGQTFTDTRAKAEEIEARAFSVAEVASSTTKESWSAGTGGERPMIELIRLYTKKAAELLQAEIIRCGEDAMDTSTGAGDAVGDEVAGGGEGGAGVTRIMFAGNISAVNRVLANVTFEAGEAHVGRCEESLVGRVCRGFSA